MFKHHVTFLGSPAGSSACRGCDGSSPCSKCGGGFEADDPALQALRWAEMVGSRGTSDSMWQVAAISQTLRDAPARAESPSWSVLDSILMRTQDMSTILRQGSNASDAVSRLRSADSGLLLVVGDALRREALGALLQGLDAPAAPPLEGEGEDDWNPPRISWQRVFKTFDSDGEFPGIPEDPDPSKPRCCLLTFSYPVQNSIEPLSKRGIHSMRIGYAFDVLAEYDPDPPPCDCSCCEFRQYVTSRYVIGGAIDEKNSKFNVMDCTVEARTKKKICPGSRNPMHSYGEVLAKMDDKRIEQYFDQGCTYKYHDTPNYPVPFGKTFELFWEFVGVVHDRCNNWSIKAKETFSLWTKGHVGSLPDAEPSGDAPVEYATEPPRDVPHGWAENRDGTRTELYRRAE